MTIRSQLGLLMLLGMTFSNAIALVPPYDEKSADNETTTSKLLHPGFDLFV